MYNHQQYTYCYNSEPASYDKTADNGNAYNDLHDQLCKNGQKEWYSCNGTFWGCCSTNPCSQNGCPSTDLVVGFLSSNPQDYAMFIPPSAQSSSTNSNPSQTSSPSSSSTLSPTSLPSMGLTGSKHSTPIGAIVGGVVGGLALLLAAIALIVWARRQKRARNHEPMVADNAGNENMRHSTDPTLLASEYYGSPKKGMIIALLYHEHRKLTRIEASFLSNSPDLSHNPRYSTMDPNASSHGGSPFPSGRYTWSDQQTIGDRSVFSEGSQVPGSEIHHGQGVQYGWTPSGVAQSGYHEPQELGSTPIYPEMEGGNVPGRY
jgi:hypothetical protein